MEGLVDLGRLGERWFGSKVGVGSTGRRAIVLTRRAGIRWAVMEKGGRSGEVDLEGMLGGLKLSEEERGAIRGAWQPESREGGRLP